MPASALDWIPGELAALDERGLRRRLEPMGTAPGPVVGVGGRALVNLCGNDYLGLAAHPRVQRAAAEAARRYGAGAGAARLVVGDQLLHHELEERLARFKGAESALLFSSGYHVNAGVPGALVGLDDDVFSDEWNHASIIDGCRLSRARVHVYRHGDVEHLGELLAAAAAGGPAAGPGAPGAIRRRRRLVVTDAVFGMDGDAAPLREIAALCERHGAMLYLDEAHSTGVLGATGSGLAEHLGVTDRVDVLMGTLGKALGSFGAFVAGSRPLTDWLVSRARTFVFTTALPPPSVAAALAALDVLESEPGRRRHLDALSARMKAGLDALGFPMGGVVAPIFPVVLGEERRALEASARLREAGFLVKAIRPPTVPRGTSRLRVSLSASHTPEQVDGFLAALAAAA
ncbi:MAG TPA: 8-amino-7-oxononanoate synthase [Anaeromyxobacteraceae bacterium]|nr:8-amino-7-oxononanoate synthase [Anaeromyxobacteraceae bacterium]